MIDEPTIGMLGSAAGLSVVIGLVMQLLRGPMRPEDFDRWAPALAVILGIVLAEAYVLVVGPVNGSSILQGALVGLVGGILSQNINTVIRRTTA